MKAQLSCKPNLGSNCLFQYSSINSKANIGFCSMQILQNFVLQSKFNSTIFQNAALTLQYLLKYVKSTPTKIRKKIGTSQCGATKLLL